MRRRLLLADDSVTIQRVIELTFADEDIDVIAVGDGDAAVARLESEPPDIVLADVGMPGRDGYEVALHVRRSPSLAHIPVVLLTGALQPVDDARAREAGCAGVLVKPFEPHMVIAKVRELLERRPGATAPAAAGDAAEPAPGASEDASAPAEAVLNAPPSPHAATQSPDDYFAELDAAFASMNDQGQSLADAPVGRPQSMDAPAPSHAAPPAATAVRPAPAPGQHTMADAFAVLLALEQGQASSRGHEDWPAALTGIVDEIAHRIAEQVTERVVRDLAPGIVSSIAERMVREEIERLRQETESPDHP
jgi:CheY-like chemotaxis protein